MSVETPECWRCSLYKGEVALLRAEIAGLRESVLALTRPPAGGAEVLEIVGTDQPERLALEAPFMDASVLYCRVSLTYRDQLSARCVVPVADPTAFAAYFEDLARHRSGWEGGKQLTIGEGQLTITCRYHGQQYRPEVGMDVVCALDDPSFDPYWTVQLHLDVAPDSLEHIGARARAVFARSDKHQCE